MNCKLFLALAIAASAAQAQAQVPAKAAAEGDEYLLLQNKKLNDHVEQRTLWVKVTPQGAQVLGEFVNPLIASGEKLYALGQVLSEYQAFDCEDAQMANGTADPKSVRLHATASKYTRTDLQDVAGKDTKPIWISPAASFDLNAEDRLDGAGSFDNSGMITGLAGPYVSIVSCDNLFSCGPHGSVTCESHTFDLAKGTELDVKAPGFFTLPNAKEKKALKWMFGEHVPITDGQAEYANWESQYGASGLEVSLLMTHETIYAASSPDWSSDYTTALFPQKQIPKAFAPYKDLPKGLEKFASSKGVTLIGFSKLQHTAAIDQFLKEHVKPAK